jgi:archaellum component FlaF (FlaF/FlaG flagellin family)
MGELSFTEVQDFMMINSTGANLISYHLVFHGILSQKYSSIFHMMAHNEKRKMLNPLLLLKRKIVPVARKVNGVSEMTTIQVWNNSEMNTEL